MILLALGYHTPLYQRPFLSIYHPADLNDNIVWSYLRTKEKRETIN